MISTCWSDAAATILVRSTRAGCLLPSWYSVNRPVSVGRDSMRGRTPLFAEISIDGRNKSTAWPPVFRSAGARSTTVTSKPPRASQYASTGPAMLAPEMRIRIRPPYGLPVSYLRRARVRGYAIRIFHPARLANGSGRHRRRPALGGHARSGYLRRRQCLGLGMGLRPLPHRADADRRSHPRGMVADVGVG